MALGKCGINHPQCSRLQATTVTLQKLSHVNRTFMHQHVAALLHAAKTQQAIWAAFGQLVIMSTKPSRPRAAPTHQKAHRAALNGRLQLASSMLSNPPPTRDAQQIAACLSATVITTLPPPMDHPLPPPPAHDSANARDIVTLMQKCNINTKSSPGPSGLYPSTLSNLLKARPDVMIALHGYFTSLYDLYPAELAGVATIGLTKPDGRIRPIGVPEAAARLHETWLLAHHRPAQLAHDVSGLKHGTLHLASAADGARDSGLAVVELDVKSAFDRVPHQLLRAAAERLQWPDRVSKVVLAAYSARTIIVGDTMLRPPPSTGMTQGSVLAPLLFAAISDAACEASGVDSFSYIDNIVLCAPPAKIQQAINKTAANIQMTLVGVGASIDGLFLNSDPIPHSYNTPMGLSPARCKK